MRKPFLTVLLALSVCSEALGHEPKQCLYTDKSVVLNIHATAKFERQLFLSMFISLLIRNKKP